MGWAILILGSFLILFVGFFAIVIGPSLLNPGTEQWGPTFSGTRREGFFGLVLMFLIIVFGATAAIAGFAQIKSGLRSKWFFYVAVGLCLLMAAVIKNTFTDDRKAAVAGEGKDYLVKIADELNRELPEMLDKETRADRVDAVAGKGLTLHYTLVNMKSADLDRAGVASFLAGYKRGQCRAATVKDVIGRGASMEYQWKAKDGVEVARLLLTADACRNQ